MYETKQQVTQQKTRNGLRKQRDVVYNRLMDILSKDQNTDPFADLMHPAIGFMKGGMKPGEITMYMGRGRQFGKSQYLRDTSGKTGKFYYTDSKGA